MAAHFTTKTTSHPVMLSLSYNQYITLEYITLDLVLIKINE